MLKHGLTLFYTVTLLKENKHVRAAGSHQTCYWNPDKSATCKSKGLCVTTSAATDSSLLLRSGKASIKFSISYNSTYILTCFYLGLSKQLKCLSAWRWPFLCWHVVREAAKLCNNKKKNNSLCNNWLHILKDENRFGIHSKSGCFCLGITTQTKDQSLLLKIINSASWAKNLLFFKITAHFV